MDCFARSACVRDGVTRRRWPIRYNWPRSKHDVSVLYKRKLWQGFGALAISHLISFFAKDFGDGEYLKSLPILLMFQPYVRIVVLHIAILIGAFAVIALGSPIVVIILLIIGKTVLDLGFYLCKHNKR